MKYLLNWMEPAQMVNTSNNYGSSFVGAIEGSALAAGEPCDCCKSSLVSSGNDLFLLFRNFPEQRFGKTDISLLF